MPNVHTRKKMLSFIKMNFRGAKAYIQWETSKIKGFPAKVYIGIRGEVVGRAF